MIAFLAVYFLVCEPDWLNCDWIVASKGVLWEGIVTAENVNYLNERYHTALVVNPDLVQGIIYDGVAPLINNATYYVILISIAGTIGTWLLCKWLRVLNFDALIFAITLNLGFIALIFISLIPYWWDTSAGPNWNYATTRNVLIFFIGILTTVLIFFIVNNLIIKQIASGAYAYDFARDIALENQLARPTEDHFKALIKAETSGDNDYIEIKEKRS